MAIKCHIHAQKMVSSICGEAFFDAADCVLNHGALSGRVAPLLFPPARAPFYLTMSHALIAELIAVDWKIL